MQRFIITGLFCGLLFATVAQAEKSTKTCEVLSNGINIVSGPYNFSRELFSES